MAPRKVFKQGFTMIEIMIVVMVLGIIIAVGVPSVRAARNRGLEKTMLANVRMLNHAVQVWSIETLQLDSTPISAEVSDYIEGGVGALAIGENVVSIDQITSKQVAHTFTIDDLYGSATGASASN